MKKQTNRHCPKIEYENNVMSDKELNTEMNGESLDIAEQRKRELVQLFPGVFTETENENGDLVTSVDFNKLKAELGEFTDVYENHRERYAMEWPGKKEALKLIQEPSRATLKPCREESLDFDNTENLFIEGDNLEVLKLLQKSYYGKVKMIYIDPPYNTGKEFIYPDKYSENLETYLAYAGLVDDEGKKFTTNTAAEGRFHTKWLNMMHSRLYLARNLLKDDGAIFISISDNEINNLKKLCDSIFGEENFVSQVVWQKSKRGDAKLIANIHEYVLVYTKNKGKAIASGVWRRRKEGVDEVLSEYQSLKETLENDHDKIRDAMLKWYKNLKDSDPRKSHKHYSRSDDRGLYFADNFAGPDDGRKSRPRHDIIHPITGKPCKKPSTGWRWDESKTQWALAQDPPRIHFGINEETIPCRKSYLIETSEEPFPSVIYADGRSATLEVESLVGKGIFQFPKNKEIIEQFIRILCKRDDIVLDLFAGSGSTGHAVYDLMHSGEEKLKYVLVQLPEKNENESKAYLKGYKTIADVGKQRLRMASKGYSLENSDQDNALDFGFKVFKLNKSNFKQWQTSLDIEVDNVLEQLELHVDHIEGSASQEDVLYELLLKSGFMPTEKVTVLDLEGGKVFSIAEDALLICLEEIITAELINSVVEKEPLQFICLDKAFHGNDQLKANTVQTFASLNQGRDKSERIEFRTV